MKKIALIIILFSLINFAYTQTISSSSSVTKHTDKDSYKISAELTGLTGVKFAQVKFSIPEGVSVSIPNDAKFQSTSSSNFVAFYIYAVPSKGNANFEFVVSPSGSKASIGMHLQYSVGDDKKDVLFDPIQIDVNESYASFSDDSKFNVVAQTEMASTKTDEVLVKNGLDNSSKTSGSYSVQILSLADYNEKRVKQFCKDHNLKFSDLIKRKVGGVTKLSVGKLSSESAQELKKKIVEENKVDGAFVIELK